MSWEYYHTPKHFFSDEINNELQKNKDWKIKSKFNDGQLEKLFNDVSVWKRREFLSWFCCWGNRIENEELYYKILGDGLVMVEDIRNYGWENVETFLDEKNNPRLMMNEKETR